MRAVVSRVSSASVSVDGKEVSRIGHGLLVLLGIARGDTERDAGYIVDKVTGLRIFDGADGRMDISLAEAGGQLMIVSQFTLLADARHGRRPDYFAAAPPGEAEKIYERTVEIFKKTGADVRTGVFRAKMSIENTGDGPVTILLDSTRAF